MRHSEKTHCPQGHPYSGDNLRVYRGKRSCRECARVKQREYSRRKRAEQRPPPDPSLPGEEWRTVEGWPYEVSNLGRVRRTACGYRKGATAGRILSTNRASPDDYPMVRLHDRDRKLSVRVHVLVATAFHGPPPSDDHEVNHKNHDRHDNRVENLEWVTRIENVMHGSKAKLTPSDVRAIRKRVAEGESQNSVARSLGLGSGHVCRIVNGELWGHVR